MSAPEAVTFLINDHGDYYPDKKRGTGFRNDFAKDAIYMSLLQRNGRSLGEVLSLFDWKSDSSKWVAEYRNPEREMTALIRNRRRACFCVGGWRDLMEDFGRGDVSCMRDIRVPLVTSRSPLRAARDEFKE